VCTAPSHQFHPSPSPNANTLCSIDLDSPPNPFELIGWRSITKLFSNHQPARNVPGHDINISIPIITKLHYISINHELVPTTKSGKSKLYLGVWNIWHKNLI